MKLQVLKRKKFWKTLVVITIIIPVLLCSAVLIYTHANQANIIQNNVAKLNEEYKGAISIGKSELSLFGNFPYISIKVDDVKLFDTKAPDAAIIMDVEDIYIGFDLLDIVKGNYNIQSILVEEGVFNIIIHRDNTTNIQNALAYNNPNEEASINIDLQKIKMRNLDFHTLDEATNSDVETFIYKGEGGFSRESEILKAHVDTDFELNVIKNKDTTFIRHKHFEVHTDLVFNERTGILDIKPSGITMEHGDFDLKGSLDTKNDMDLDLSIEGTKPNFDMLIAFAPTDLIPVLESYKNEGDIYFNASIKGPANAGNIPLIDVEFGAGEAFLENTAKTKRIDKMGFKGHFTNGENRDMSTMEFSLTDLKANLEKGVFVGDLFIRNFESPEVDMQINSNFNLNFITEFLNLKNVQDLSGIVALKMNFHDIIDLSRPELALQKLNRAYFAELKIDNLSLTSENLPVPLDSLNAHLVMNGKALQLNTFNLQMDESDLSITGFLSDLPAIVHQTDTPIEAHFDILSKQINIATLTKHSTQDSIWIDEQIKDLQLGLSFKSSAKDFISAQYLPKGEFFIDSLHVQLKHYPHEFHNFHADILVDDEDLKIVDFTGHIDDSDFHFNGLIHDYKFWMKHQLDGVVDLDINLVANQLKLEDLFSYKGENYVPEEYKHEQFDKLSLHAKTKLQYKDSTLYTIDVNLDKLDTKMKLHPLRFKNFKGLIHYENEHVVIKDFYGEIGKTNFNIDLNYYLGKDETIKKRDNYLGLNANYIDYDELFNFNLNAPEIIETQVATIEDVAAHKEVFNLYQLPFTDMKFNVDVDHFIYHRIDLQNITADLRTTPNHYIYIDTLNMNAAGGNIDLSGYFNGSDADHIYMKPDLKMRNIDIDKLLFKFENFGQDHLVSDNLEGKVTTQIKGNIRVYPDLVPDLDQSEIEMDVQVINGSLKNYDPMEALSDYMGDKNLKNIRFDTLQNHIDIKEGTIIIPNMTIESTIGHMEISGNHDSEHNIDYYLRIPWKIVKKAALRKIFGGKKEIDSTKVEEIVKVDSKRKTRYLNLKVRGTVDDYKISLGKNK
ncbi:AsmA family protein [Winogradskyella sp. PG-2]|uniref:AsmA family protein n=1 Tax=Winogradskyella sp. PG-2 TaxID=754409 RepID=UPI0004588904|nr:AsmA-like C-terminal region-containing protein [Winogradskyella sp. PG-2]BAO77022.1 hypothetical protein WPG_2792 [Winogradskyella sp. PG-2]